MNESTKYFLFSIASFLLAAVAAGIGFKWPSIVYVIMGIVAALSGQWRLEAGVTIRGWFDLVEFEGWSRRQQFEYLKANWGSRNEPLGMAMGAGYYLRPLCPWMPHKAASAMKRNLSKSRSFEEYDSKLISEFAEQYSISWRLWAEHGGRLSHLPFYLALNAAD